MAHNHLKAGIVRKATRVPAPPMYKRKTMLGEAEPLGMMVQLSDNVWRRVYMLDNGQSYVVVNGAEQIIGPHAHGRIQSLLRGGQ